jgi:hypothetical protein
MRRKLVKAVLTVTAFACLIVGSGMVSSAIWSSGARSATAAKSDFRVTVADASDVQQPVITPAVVTNINFDQTFSDAAGIRSPNDTPPLREKFRNVGWTRIIAPR